MNLRHAAKFLAEDTALDLSPQKTPHSHDESSNNPSDILSGTVEQRDRNLQDDTKKVYLAGIFDTENFHWGPELFKIIVDLLNNHNDGWHDDIFNDGTQIEYLIGNSACDPVQAAQAYWDVRTLFDGLINGVVGCRCSSASLTVATIAGLEEVCMISPSSTSEKLSDHRLFSRVVSADTGRGQVAALVELLRAFGWKRRVSIMITDKQYSRDLSTEFQRLWVGDNDENGGDIAYHSPAIKIKANNEVDRSSVEQAFRSAPTDDPTINSRIILLFGHSEHAYQILQIAKEMNFQPDSVWVGPQAWVGRLPLETSWIPPVPGYIGVTPASHKENAVYQDILGRIADVQAAEGKEVWSQLPDYAAEYMIDSIVAMAKALSSLPHEDRRNGTLVTERIREQTLENGISGQVRFTAEGDRRDPQFTVTQLQKKEGELMWVDTGSITVSSSNSSRGTTDIDFDAVCFAKKSCGEIPSDSYPVPRDPARIWVPVVISTTLVGFAALGVKHWRSKIGKRKYRQKLAQLAKQLGKQMQGMVEAIDDLTVRSAEEYTEKIDMAQRDSRLEAVSWYWAEDACLVSEQRNVLTGTNFVGYQDEISNQIEHAYQLWKEGKGFQQYDVDLTGKVQKLNNAHTGLRYQIDFEAMCQQNAKTSFERKIHREENAFFDSEATKILPELPPNIDFSTEGENLLPTIKGQVIQISKIHPVDGNWAYGNVLFDPLLHEAILDKPAEDGDLRLNAALMKALHNRPTSGWFPKNAVTKDADVNIMQKLLGSLGGGGAGIANLSPPKTWAMDPSRTATVLTGRIEVSPSTSVYDEVVNYFTSALYSQKDKVTVLKVERIQNLPLWQSYAVKRQTVKARDAKNPEHRLNNPHLDEDERKWLFHGTTHDVLEKIETQGFNRAFAGKNAVAYGKGVYFARDACYSASETYSEPDAKGVQRIFLSRVVVGDWCKGSNGQLTPDPKPYNNLELFDTTVDNVANPSIFVVYHDSQAYPEYLVSFKTKKSRK